MNDNKEVERDYDHDLHVAWCNVAMGLATEYAEAFCNHQCCDDKDYLGDLNRARLELKRHLFGQPASMGPSDDTALLRQCFDAMAYWLEHGETPGAHDMIQRTHDALRERLGDEK